MRFWNWKNRATNYELEDNLGNLENLNKILVQTSMANGHFGIIMKNDKKSSDEDLSERQKRIEEIGIESLKRSEKYRPTPEGHESKTDPKVVPIPEGTHTPLHIQTKYYHYRLINRTILKINIW